MRRAIDELIRRILQDDSLPGFGMQREDHLRSLVALLGEVLDGGIPGDVVELGSNAGLTAALLQAVLTEAGSERELHAFDSFEGLPPKTAEDGARAFDAGSCRATRDQLESNFARLGQPLPVMHPGWFADTIPHELPPAIAFVHLDADLYRATREGLEGVYPRLSRGGVIVLHDYHDPTTREGVPPHVDPHEHVTCPGVKQACDEFFADRPEAVLLLFTDGLQSGQGIVRRS